MEYCKRDAVAEAITFEEFVEYGRQNGGNIVNGMPWSFEYRGLPVTHENDDCYLIPFLGGTVKFNRGDMLVTDAKGVTFPKSAERFAATYERVKRGGTLEGPAPGPAYRSGWHRCRDRD